MRSLFAAACLLAGLLGTPAAATPIPFQATTPGFVTFTAPVDGLYEISALGAMGGTAFGTIAGGSPALAVGDFFLSANQVLTILVGGKGTTGQAGGGGGGGTFVVSGTTPLLVAGGGGGGGISGSQDLPGMNASLTTSGTGDFGTAGTGGNGGSVPANGGGNGGGGFLTGGGSFIGGGGASFLDGGAGGAAGGCCGVEGGIGGGAGSSNVGGAGGGYSGGGGSRNGFPCCSGAGGGGSFNAGLDNANYRIQIADSMTNGGDGQVLISLLDEISVPEPATAAILGVGIAGLLARRRRG